MSHLFESIRLINGQVRNLSYHQDRVNRAFEDYKTPCHLHLKALIKAHDLPQKGLYKLRISYAINYKKVELKTSPYNSKKIKSLKLIELENESYLNKYEDRGFIDAHYKSKESYDDVLFYRDNKILDTSYCNIAFYNGKKWLTPKEPLLRGTMREQLIAKGKIIKKDISIHEISSFKKARLFNAMILWGDKKDININKIQP
jgi:4-amino-4-deoxychorismate lyase